MSSSGVYGTRVPARVNPQTDIEIFYNYRPTRGEDSTINNTFIKLDSALLTQAIIQSNEPESANIKAFDTGMELEGMYNLKLPLNYFNQKGFYTVYIKPREHQLVIQDVGVLVTYPDVRGIVIDSSQLDDAIRPLFTTNNALVGYRIVYINDNHQRENYYRLITSNNKCEPVIQNLTDTNQKAVRYRYNESSNLVFLTLTPSTASTFKPNSQPFIGKVAQKIILTNTLFEPVMLDIEMVDKDAETISTMLEGSQLRDLDKGLITTFNSNNEIYHQTEHYTLKDDYTLKPVYEVKKNKSSSIDFSQTMNEK